MRAAAMQDALIRYRALQDANPGRPIFDLLPLIFKLKGQPFSINEGHFLQEPMYKLTGSVPRRMVFKAGRQVAKSTGLAASGILRVATRPYFNHLTVTPLFEQVRKFSGNYVRPFLVESTFKTHLLRPGSDNSVLQRTIANGSNLFYNYASNSADRIRGTSADGVDLDEMQDFDLSVIPIIESCMDASKYKIVRYSGTPKTKDGPLEVYWQQSSQAIWHIPCQETGCKRVNRCSADGDLLKMIQSPVTLVCAGCGKPVDSRLGYYVHDRPDLRNIFPGYHLPQPAFPMHYADPRAWYKLQDALKTKPLYVIYNEILGESIDVGLKMVTQEDLEGAGKIVARPPAKHNTSPYIITTTGVDWGGKGKELTTDKEEFISNTAIAVAGMRADGVVEITSVRRAPYEADHAAEAALVRNTASDSQSDWVAHDFGGAGDVRETVLIHSGWPKKKVMPCTYSIMSVNKPIVYWQRPGATGARSSYTLDKTRSLQLLCALIKTRQVLLPEWSSNREALSDFFSLFEESIEGPRGSARRLVKKVKGRTDDVCHAINFAVMACYHATRRWPNIADAFMKLEGDAEAWDESDR